MQIQIEKALPRDIYEAGMIARKWSNKELGFVSLPALKVTQKSGGLLVAVGTMSNPRAVLGFLKFYHRKQDKNIRLDAMGLRPDYRYKGIGTELINCLKRELAETGGQKIKLKAPINIGANIFYSKCGFTLINTEKGRKIPLNIWEWALPTHNKG